MCHRHPRHWRCHLRAIRNLRNGPVHRERGCGWLAGHDQQRQRERLHGRRGHLYNRRPASRNGRGGSSFSEENRFVQSSTAIGLSQVVNSSGFILAPALSALSIPQGAIAANNIAITDVGGFTGSVTLGVSGLPSGLNARILHQPRHQRQHAHLHSCQHSHRRNLHDHCHRKLRHGDGNRPHCVHRHYDDAKLSCFRPRRAREAAEPAPSPWLALPPANTPTA